MRKPYISIIIPLYEGQRYIIRLLKMLKENVLYKDLNKTFEMEIIFVNDYPFEKIQYKSDDIFCAIECINNYENIGIHKSRVAGIQASKGAYIIMLDQDDIICENWLYSQLKKIIETKADYCVCNGWSGRFKLLWNNEQNYEKRVNDVGYYLAEGNAIISPGQVMIRKDALPNEWLVNVIKNNGADDWMLWVMVLKKGYKFVINNDYLFYHTPERTSTSIKMWEMTNSIKEAKDILLTEGMLLGKEKISVEHMLTRYVLNYGEVGKNGVTNVLLKSYARLCETNRILQRWMKLKVSGIDIDAYFKKKNIKSIAIYGLGTLGELLYLDMYSSGVEIKYGIDKCAKDFRGELSIYRVENILESVDIVIVTIINIDERALDVLKEKINCEVISMEDFLLRLEEDKYMSSI